MRIPFVSLALLGGLAGVGGGCGGSQGKLMADTMQFDAKQGKWQPLIEYKAPDIDELTGIDSSEEPSETPAAPAAETKPATPAPAPAPAP